MYNFNIENPYQRYLKNYYPYPWQPAASQPEESSTMEAHLARDFLYQTVQVQTRSNSVDGTLVKVAPDFIVLSSAKSLRLINMHNVSNIANYPHRSSTFLLFGTATSIPATPSDAAKNITPR